MKIIPSARKAQLLDYILLGWQTSTYTLRHSSNKWFMKPYADIVADTGIPKSTLERYIKELHEEGFIERRQALYSRTNEEGEFEVKKGAYIYITDKLLALIKPPKPVAETIPATINTLDEPHYENHQEPDKNQSKCDSFNTNEGFDPLKMRGLYIRDLYSFSFNNTITFKQLTESVDKATLQQLTHQFETIQTLLRNDIKEEIPDEVKKLVLGTFFNLTFEHKKRLSSPKQLAAEYLFVLINNEFYLPNVTCFKHRNNILSKMIRENRWRTPKGFYKHFYLGQDFKDQQQLREDQWQQQKHNEIHSNYDIDINNGQKNERLIELEAKMLEKNMVLDTLTRSIYQQSCEEMIVTIRGQIQEVKRELEHLWHQQFLIEQEIESSVFHSMKRCA